MLAVAGVFVTSVVLMMMWCIAHGGTLGSLVRGSFELIGFFPSAGLVIPEFYPWLFEILRRWPKCIVTKETCHSCFKRSE